MKIIILCGGLGTRLGIETKNTKTNGKDLWKTYSRAYY